MERRKNRRLLHGSIALLATCAYIIVFIFFFIIMGRGVAAIAILPVMVFGFLYGLWGGILAGILSFPLNLLLYQILGEDVLRSVVADYGVGTALGQVVVVAIGGITLENAKHVVEAGADALSAISAVLTKDNVKEEIMKFQGLFR